MSDHPVPNPQDGEPDPFAGLPPELAQMLRGLTSGTPDPQIAEMMQQFGIDKIDPAMLGMVANQMQAMFAPGNDDPVNQEQATTVARAAAAAAGGDATVSEADRRAVTDALGVARLWLDQVTDFEGAGVEGAAWSRAEWVEATMPTWCALVEPVATAVSGAISTAMTQQFDQLGSGDVPEGMLPPGMDLSAMRESMAPMLGKMSSGMFSLQLGQAVGGLSAEVLSGTEVALPLLPDRRVVLLPTNIAGYADGLEVDLSQVRLFLAVRESARSRLFTSVPWLASALMAAVRDYARDITIDTEGISSSLAQVDVSDPERLQEALQDNLFAPSPSPAQQAALARLETLLALVEGWVDVVTSAATRPHLPQAEALGETVRRRRASGGPAEKTFASLVGLELRPRRLRDAANLWTALTDRVGAQGRDQAWATPDLAPRGEDLDDILGYVERATTGAPQDDMDRALAELLDNPDGPGAADSTDDNGDGTHDGPRA